jgi:parvulin-like peptidyl-prolyl isomerase
LRTPTVPLLVVVTIAALAGCGERRRPADAGASGVVATVNGVALTDRDLEHRARGAATAGAPGHEAAAANVLETLVRDELVAQKAVELGLDRDEEYRRRLQDLEAQLHAFQRQQLAVLLRSHVRERAAVTEAEARAWFDRNADSVRARLHVLQILRKGDRAEIVRDREDVVAGTPFEEVAARRFPGLPASVRAPWDLGELHWSQLPPAWRGVVDRLEPGQVSEVVEGENDRFWVLKLAGKRIDPGITFETEKDRIVETLRQRKAQELYDGMLAEMKGKARVVYTR